MVGGGTLTAGRYDPWGTPIDNQISPFGFAGELQGDGGLVYLRARWYTPQRGVFTARDPFAGWAERPYSQHYFQYGYSNPVRYTDPSGRAGIKGAEKICPFGTYWNPVIEDCLPNPPVPPPTNPAEPERPRPPRPGIGTLPSVFPSVGVGARNPPQGGADAGDAAIKAGICTIATLSALDALTRVLEGLRDRVDTNDNSYQVLYRGERSSMTPTLAFITGILPKGDNTDLLAHVSTNTARSIYVSTSRNFNIGVDYAGKNGYVYVIYTKRGIDVNQILGAGSPFPDQEEVAIPGGILPNEIMGAFPKQKGALTSEYIPNPGFTGR